MQKCICNIPKFKRQPSNWSRLKRVNIIIFFSYIIKTYNDNIAVQAAFDSVVSDKCSHIFLHLFLSTTVLSFSAHD